MFVFWKLHLSKKIVKSSLKINLAEHKLWTPRLLGFQQRFLLRSIQRSVKGERRLERCVEVWLMSVSIFILKHVRGVHSYGAER